MYSVQRLRQYLLCITLGSLGALVFLFSIPGDAKNAFFLGISPARWALGLVLLLILGGVAWLTWTCLTSDAFAQALVKRGQGLLERRRVWQGVIGLSTVLCVGSLAFFFKLTDAIDDRFQPYMLRLAPLVLLIMLVSFLNLLFFLQVFTKPEERQTVQSDVWVNGLAFGVILLLAGVMATTGLGIRPPRNSWGMGWGDPAVPILTGQGLIAFGLGLVFFVFFMVGKGVFNKLRWGFSAKKVDGLICLVIWGCAALLWTQKPFTANWFAPTPTPPNFERYPYSDAFIHDAIAQNILIGEGLKWAEHRVPRRPLYGLFLATLHSLAGQDYDKVVQGQILVLALFPVGMYLLGTVLHHRASGVVGAALIIFRELNALELSDTINVSHAKLMMSDLPTAVLVCGFAVLCTLWLQNPQRNRNWAFILGGVLGLTMLIRTQAVFLISVPLVVSLPLLRGNKTGLSWGKHVGMLIVGLLVVVSPWLWRNWQLTGGLAFDETNSQIGMIARRLSPSPEAFDDTLRPGENEAQYTRRMTQEAMQFILKHPGEAADLILSNFFHSQFSTVIMLPTSGLGETAEEFVRETGYWFKWEGVFKSTTYFPLALNLSLLALGLGAVWKHKKWLGLIPLGIFWVYSLSNALATISGWRFMLPADWVGILYFSIGFIQLCLYVGHLFVRPSANVTQPDAPVHARTATRSPSIVFISAIGLFFVGLSLPIVEQIIPPRYVSVPKAQTIAYLTEAGYWVNLPETVKLEVEHTLTQPDSVVLFGRGLYPRYFSAEEGLPGGDWPSSSPRGCNRLSFFLVGPTDADVMMPQDHTVSLPNGLDLVVLGYPEESFIEAVVIIPLDPSLPPLLKTSQFQSCPALTP